jgi:hypothetical protein
VTNPNALADSELAEVLGSSDIAWNEWLKALDSPQTLQRLLDAAGASDISLRRFKQIESRLAEVQPVVRVVQKDRSQYESISGGKI